MKALQRIGLFLFLQLVLFAVSFSWIDLRNGELPSTRSINSLLGVKLAHSTETPAQIFKGTYHKILNEYYEELEPKELKYAGIEGMIAALGDPHTVFLVPNAAAEFSNETKANFVGVGARLTSDPLGAKVVTVFDNSPAARAGLAGGDVITGVDGKTMLGLAIDEVVSYIRGKEGTIVRLQVLKPDRDKHVVLPIRRASLTAPTVDSKYLKESKIGYMVISSFSEPTARQFDNELSKLEQEDLSGLVIDLRNNPGGLLETAVELLSRFTSNKTVVKMRFRDKREAVEKTYAGYVHKFNYPIVVLINEDSASAAEIFSGALRDYRLATLVGEHSYGKASVQNVTPLVDGSMVKITIAKYFLPGGGDISRKVDEDGLYISGGIEPDVTVELDPDVSMTLGDPKEDLQLKKAIQLIRQKTEPALANN